MKKNEKDFVHLLFTPFTGLGRHNGFRGNDWLRFRIEFFKKYTLQSLLQQSNRDFIHWICWRPEEEKNSLVKELFNYLDSIGYRCIFTFSGIAMFDDVYPEKEGKERLKNTLKQISLSHNLKKALAGKKYIYETISPSDDFYHKDTIQSIQEQEFGYKKALIHFNGYCYNFEEKRLGTWIPAKGYSPPFYTIMYPADVFLDPEKHFNYLEPYRSHEDVEKYFNWVKMPDNRYLVGMHGKNISTVWHLRERGWKTIITLIINPFNWKRLYNKVKGSWGIIYRKKMLLRNPFIGKEITDQKKKNEILSDFGIFNL